jgi:hypothetical protein
MIKFLIVAIMAFLVSNLLASAYKWIFKKALSKRVLRMAIIIAAVLLTTAIYVKQQTVGNNVKAELSQENISTPEVGFHTAVIEGNLKLVRQHIHAGSDIDLKESTGGSSPLISAALFGKTDVALVLIEAGADVNFQNNEGSTPLITAAFFCRPEIVEALLENAADKTIKNNSGSTALDAVSASFESVEGIYDYFQETLGPIGLKLDYQYIKETRPKIAKRLK